MSFYEDEQLLIRTGQPMFDREETISVDETNGTHYSLTTKVPLFDSEEAEADFWNLHAGLHPRFGIFSRGGRDFGKLPS